MARRFNRAWMAGARASDSKWEGRLRDTIFKGIATYHPCKIPYVIYKTYEPDFLLDAKKIYIESKGRFKDSNDAMEHVQKGRAIEKLGYELVFLFYKRNTPMPHARKRKKCGTKRTHEEWAEKNGFRYFYEDTIGEIL
jgi:hypothetical protein